MMKITVNGKERSFDEKITLSGMVDQLALKTEGMVVERNLEVVSRSEYSTVILEDGDKIELIRLVGGG